MDGNAVVGVGAFVVDVVQPKVPMKMTTTLQLAMNNCFAVDPLSS